MTSWPPIGLNTRVGSLVGQKIAVGGRGPEGLTTIVYVEFSSHRRGVRAAISDSAPRPVAPAAASPIVPPDLTLGEVVLAHADVEPWSAVEVPGLKWPLASHPRYRALWIVGALVMVVLAVWLMQPALAIFSLISMGPMVTAKLRGRIKPDAMKVQAHALGDDGRPIPPQHVWAMLPPSAVDTTLGALSPADRITVLKERYGALRGDIAYRIENSALFDGAVAATQRLELALLAWDAGSPAAEALADEVEASFDAARRNAEELGFAHLPATARDTARRAQGAARAALGTTVPAEREAAARKAAELLRSLALYYLPGIDPAAPRLVASPRAIEPA